MRFNSVISLASVTFAKKENGAFSRTETLRKVFANPYKVGANEYFSAREAGLHADAQVQIRSNEYQGEKEAQFNGERYDIVRVKETGDFCILTLSKKAENE